MGMREREGEEGGREGEEGERKREREVERSNCNDVIKLGM